jgi:hypothetical protein
MNLVFNLNSGACCRPGNLTTLKLPNSFQGGGLRSRCSRVRLCIEVLIFGKTLITQPEFGTGLDYLPSRPKFLEHDLLCNQKIAFTSTATLAAFVFCVMWDLNHFLKVYQREARLSVTVTHEAQLVGE